MSPDVAVRQATDATAPVAIRGASVREDLRTSLRQDGRRMATVFLAGLLLTAIAAALAPRHYVAEAALLLRFGREYVYTPEVGDASQGSPMAYDRDQTLVAEARILASRDVFEAVLDKLGVGAVYPKIAASGDAPEKQRARALLQMGKALDAELLKGSNLLQVGFRHDDAQTASHVLASVIDAYLQKRVAIFSSASLRLAQSDFDARALQLDTAEQKLAAYKRAHGVLAFNEEQSLLLAQRNTLELRRSEVELAHAEAGGRVDTLRAHLRNVPKEVTLSRETRPGEATENTLRLLLDLKLKERDVRSKFFDSVPVVQDVRQDIDRTTEYLRQLQTSPSRTERVGRSPVRDAAETELSKALTERSQGAAGRTTLASQLAAVDKRLAELAACESELRGLERARRLAEGNYEASAKRLRDERALADLDRQRKSNVSIVQPPSTPLEARTYRAPIAAAGTLLSLAAALSVGFAGALRRERARPMAVGDRPATVTADTARHGG